MVLGVFIAVFNILVVQSSILIFLQFECLNSFAVFLLGGFISFVVFYFYCFYYPHNSKTEQDFVKKTYLKAFNIKG
jgi:hypothetical protein